MNIDDRELEELREVARLARIDPGDAAVTRLRARVAERLAEPEPLWDAMVTLFRPVALAVLALLIAASILLSRQMASDSTDLLARSTPVISVDQEIYGD